MKKVTVRDVAQRAGVSPAAVSMVFHNRPGISQEVRNRVLEVAAELGYPATRPRDSRVLQLIVFKRHGRVVSDNPFMDILTRGVTDEASRLGYHLSISYFYGDKDRQEQIRSLCSLASEGMLLLATEMSEEDLDLFRTIPVPLVLLDNFSTSMSWDCVHIDNLCGVQAAVQYLIRRGHTRIGYLHSSVDIRNFRERQEGYLRGCRALPEQDARDAARRVIRADVSTELACRMMRSFLSSHTAPLPTAFFADNDHIAAGCSRALQEAGYRIPEDVSILGFDDSPIARMTEPALTTMAVPKERMGALAVERLVERIRNPQLEHIRIAVMPELVERDSVLSLVDFR